MSQGPASQKPVKAMSQRATLLVAALAVLIVTMPFLFWRGTWFGRELNDEQISEYLANEETPREAQHAIVQISERISRSDPSVEKWYPQILDLADHPLAQLRVNIAWLMGQDNESEQVHAKLKQMLGDPDPLVRRNAALSLIRFGDEAGRPELLAMLGDFTVKSPHAGIFINRLQAGDLADAETLLARVEIEGREEPLEIRSPVPGIVKERLLEDGSAVKPGDPVMMLGPDSAHVFEALRGLYLVGTPEDLDAVRRFFQPREHMPAQVAQQARLTAEAIRRRGERGGHFREQPPGK